MPEEEKKHDMKRKREKKICIKLDQRTFSKSKKR